MLAEGEPTLSPLDLNLALSAANAAGGHHLAKSAEDPGSAWAIGSLSGG